MSPKEKGYPTDYELDEEDNATYDGKILSHLVGVVSEVRLEETRLGSICDLTASTRKSKSHKIIKISSRRTRVSKSSDVSL